MTISKEAIESLAAELEPFAAVAEHDIGADERATDCFAPMKEYNRAPRLRVGDLRLAKAALETFKQEIAPALPFLPIAGEGKVKALEWEDAKDKGYSQANCALGQYQVSWLGEFECWQCYRPSRSGLHWKDNFSRHPNKDEAKAAAQADYETRILSALISSPGKDGGQEVELRCVGGDCEYSKAVSMPEYQCVGKCQYEGDHTAGRKLSLWFFRDLSGEQRGKLFGLFGMNDAQRDTNHGYQAMALSQVVRALSTQPASTALVEAAMFLADRLEDFRQKIDDIDDEREFEGHVIPALARLRSALSASQSTSREGER